MGLEPPIVIDTNVFVAAAFNPRSRSARIVDMVERNERRMVWHRETRRETERVLRKIPTIQWKPLVPLFKKRDRYPEPLRAAPYDFVPDPEDRKFVALAEATGAVLITQDEHLLNDREQTEVPILSPEEYMRRSTG